MKFEVIYKDFDTGYIVRLEDGSTVMVNLGNGMKLEDRLPILLKFGQWYEPDEPIDDAIMQKLAGALA